MGARWQVDDLELLWSLRRHTTQRFNLYDDHLFRIVLISLQLFIDILYERVVRTRMVNRRFVRQPDHCANDLG